MYGKLYDICMSCTLIDVKFVEGKPDLLSFSSTQTEMAKANFERYKRILHEEQVSLFSWFSKFIKSQVWMPCSCIHVPYMYLYAGWYDGIHLDYAHLHCVHKPHAEFLWRNFKYLECIFCVYECIHDTVHSMPFV